MAGMGGQDQQHGGKGYSVPTGLPYALQELRSRLGSANDLLKDLYDGAYPAEYEPVADSLYGAYRTAADLAPARNVTGCKEHPDGAVDPTVPDGWGRCLICNHRRRLNERSAPTPAEETPRLPEGPARRATLGSLTAQFALVNERSFDLGTSSRPKEFAALAEALHRAFVLARELSRPRNSSGCAQHPGAPVDPDAPPGEECIFCAGRRRQAQRAAGTPQMLPRVPRGERRMPLRRRFERPPGL
ncbi:hypothetical protein ACQPZG_16990 [Streptomyces sp. CA-294286]|uniref:hypothetical protein n=1 Tax=Streptomyces sp. CA-294286 TaxID=3240070 RepID=UPI003D8AD347